MRPHLFHLYVRACGIQAKRHILLASIAFILAFSLFPSTAFAGHDFMTGTLRVDLAEVNVAHDYIVSIKVGGYPGSGGEVDFTTGWLGIHIPDFVQVGFMTDTSGVHWFVEEFSSVTLQCLQGIYKNDIGAGAEACYGLYFDRATIGNFQTVELVTYPGQGFWIVRVYDQYANALDVAKLDYSTPTNNITQATVTTETFYAESSDPYLLANFTYSHPQYWIGGTGYPFAEWPPSEGTNTNRISPSPTSICPKHYYAKLNFGGDPRVWYAGSKTQGSGVCTSNLF